MDNILDNKIVLFDYYNDNRRYNLLFSGTEEIAKVSLSYTFTT